MCGLPAIRESDQREVQGNSNWILHRAPGDPKPVKEAFRAQAALMTYMTEQIEDCYGRHICLGASPARMESRIAIEELLLRWPDYEIPADGAVRMHSSNVRGFSGLTIEVA